MLVRLARGGWVASLSLGFAPALVEPLFDTRVRVSRALRDRVGSLFLNVVVRRGRARGVSADLSSEGMAGPGLRDSEGAMGAGMVSRPLGSLRTKIRRGLCYCPGDRRGSPSRGRSSVPRPRSSEDRASVS